MSSPSTRAGSSSSSAARSGWPGSPRTSSRRGRRSTSRSGSGRAGSEELLHLLEEELTRFGLAQIERVMVDQLLLELEPFGPAYRADFAEEPGAGIVGEGRKGLLVAHLAAAGAGDGGRGGKVNGDRSTVNGERSTVNGTVIGQRD